MSAGNFVGNTIEKVAVLPISIPPRKKYLVYSLFTWRDEAGQTWLDPTQETVQTYLIGLCRELADLGFDEILLTHCAYPTQGETDTLRDTAEREAALSTFCRRLQGALADEDVTLSIQGQGDSGSPDAPSGQTTGLLATFGRVWAAEADQAALAAFDPVLLPEEP